MEARGTLGVRMQIRRPRQHPGTAPKQLRQKWVAEFSLGSVATFVGAVLYYEQFGFVSLPSNELELLLPVKTIQEALAQNS